MKFESRFIATVDVVHNLALLAGLLTYLHTFTHTLAHAHRRTPAYINNHTFTHSHTHAHLYTQSPHRHTNIHVRTTYTLTQKNRYSIHIYTQTHAYNTIQSHAYTHNAQILTQIHTFKYARINVYIIIHMHICMHAYFTVFKTFKLTLMHTNMHILLTYTTHTTHTLINTHALTHTNTHTLRTHTCTHFAHTIECVCVSMSDRVQACLHVYVASAHVDACCQWVCVRTRKCECTSICLCVGL